MTIKQYGGVFGRNPSFNSVEVESLSIAGNAVPDASTILVDGDIGTSVQGYDAGLASIAGLTTAADKMIYATASDTYAVTDITSAGRAILDDADASAQRTTLGLGTIATQDADSVDIDGGAIDGVSLGGITSAGFSGAMTSQEIASGSANVATSTYRQIVEFSALEPNTLYQYYITIDATDLYQSIGFINYSPTADRLIPLMTAGINFSPNSSVADVRINAGWLEFQQKSGGTQLVRWRVSRLFKGR